MGRGSSGGALAISAPGIVGSNGPERTDRTTNCPIARARLNGAYDGAKDLSSQSTNPSFLVVLPENPPAAVYSASKAAVLLERSRKSI